MNHQAIYNTHPNVVSIDDTTGAMDAQGNSVAIDQAAYDAELARLDAEHAATQYQRDRRELYPTFEDVIVSLAEKTEGYSDNMWKEIKAKRKEVRDGNPKPAGRQAADTEFQTRRQSAIDKLVALGLTAEEIEAIIL